MSLGQLSLRGRRPAPGCGRVARAAETAVASGSALLAMTALLVALGLLAVGCSTKPVNAPVRTNPGDGAPGGGDGPRGQDDGGGDGGAGDAFVRPEVGPCTTPPVAKKALGERCTCTGECASGHCVDFVCCNTACTGPCLSCNQASTMGSCAPVPDGRPPVVRADCVPSPVETCGNDGLCNGAGACRQWPDGTVCAAGTCEAGAAAIVGQKVCSGGKCAAGASVACFPFACDQGTVACFAQCAGDAQCAGERCEGGLCGKKPLGAVCAGAGECESGFCADGVCCNVACSGACVSCAAVGSKGECVPVPAGHEDPHKQCLEEPLSTCGMSGVCNGQGGCASYAAGTVCKPGACSGASYTPPSVCNGLGLCEPGAPISCAPFTCADGACKGSCKSNSDCTPPSSCQGDSCGKKGLGQACAATAECESGFCVDGVCCESACEGKCVFCAQPSALGRCTNVPAGVADPRYVAGETDADKVCLDQGNWTCGTSGKCDGQGGCLRYPNGTVCQAESCDRGSNRYSIGTCRDGQCAVNSRACAPNRCNGNQCGQRCAADTECATPNVCVRGSCGKKPNGEPCAASNPGECASGICAQGVCCSGACTGSCVSCALQEARGECRPVPNGAADPAGACKDMKVQSCGTDGVCDGQRRCRVYPAGAVCAAASCAAGRARKASLCDGKGSCAPGDETACTPITVCNAQGTACEKTCTSDNQCVSGTKCFQGRCGLLDNGQACTGNSDCKTGFCVDGLCCDKACGGNNQNDCQACARTAGAAADGKCGARAAAARCSDGNACTTGDACAGTVCVGAPVVCTALSQCHEAGVCDKDTGKCGLAFKPSGAVCDDANRCSTGDRCNGTGACVGTPVSCPAGDQCKTGMCDPSTGMCAMPPKIDGTACDDGSRCTQTDKCRGGVCVGESPVTCTAELCKDAGTCNAATGQCSQPNKPDGTMCGPADNKCMLGKCAAGVCGNVTAKTCTSGNECQTAGTCDPRDGQCKNGTTRPDGTGCSDDDLCTEGDACQGGLCKGTAKVCPGAGVCKGVCDPGNGSCKVAVGTPCKNDATCTTGETCQADGTCAGAPRTDCRQETQCWYAEPCDPGADKCGTWQKKPEGTGCDDYDKCTVDDRCTANGCHGSAKACPALEASAQCKVNACEPASGDCKAINQDDGAECDDGDLCTARDACSGGLCRPGTRKMCDVVDQCHTPACDPKSGACVKGEPATGTDCDDGDPCTREDRCLAGKCVAGLPQLCADTQVCTADRCEPAPDEPSGFRCVHTPIENCPIPGVGVPPPPK
jgi:hypothetical protein